MNSHVGVNILVMLSGVAMVALLFVLGRRMLSEQNPVRRWAVGHFKRLGAVETARRAGLVMLTVVFSVLAILYS